ncbi:MAG: OmpH family outer membrane protein [Bacteroidaceae bacterium]|jgi:outer membrane protein|nr:OmpH family outer membrane protein [Bacteroidaceae bacterium]
MKKLLVALMMVLPMCASAQKFGHFDSAAVIQSMPEYTTAQNEVQAKAKTYEDELKRMQDEFRTKAEDYEKNQATLIEDVKKRREQELQELNQRLQEYYNKSQQDLNQLQGEKLQGIQQKLVKAVEEVGQAGGYVYIMDTSAGIPYISKSLSTDVTSQVKAKLGIK